MFEDEDLWPVQCPNCGHISREPIGWLKESGRHSCPACSAKLWYDKNTFLDVLDDAQRAVDNFSRSIRAGKEKP
jgi:DNA-directed RNA polymerase subunit RPC12/RpoP